MTADRPRASVVITNHNYARYLTEAIDSALGQTYEDFEVIVVDDGSTDDSRAIIRSFGRELRAVLLENGGQTRALNEGFSVTTGDFVVFLDADDVLESDALRQAYDAIISVDAVKAHWPLRAVDEHGSDLGWRHPRQPLSTGDILLDVLRGGPEAHSFPPTSGNAWVRTFLESVFPLPRARPYGGGGSASADWYLSTLAAVHGPIAAVSRPLGTYRVHGRNDYAGKTFDRKLDHDLWAFEYCAAGLETWSRSRAVPHDPGEWRRRSWIHRVARSVSDVSRFVPAGEPVLLLDQDEWATGGCMRGRRTVPLIERSGSYAGPPADDGEAVDSLVKLLRSQLRYVVVAWPAFWWLDYYPMFAATLARRLETIFVSDSIIVFGPS